MHIGTCRRLNAQYIQNHAADRADRTQFQVTSDALAVEIERTERLPAPPCCRVESFQCETAARNAVEFEGSRRVGHIECRVQAGRLQLHLCVWNRCDSVDPQEPAGNRSGRCNRDSERLSSIEQHGASGIAAKAAQLFPSSDIDGRVSRYYGGNADRPFGQIAENEGRHIGRCRNQRLAHITGVARPIDSQLDTRNGVARSVNDFYGQRAKPQQPHVEYTVLLTLQRYRRLTGEPERRRTGPVVGHLNRVEIRRQWDRRGVAAAARVNADAVRLGILRIVRKLAAQRAGSNEH